MTTAPNPDPYQLAPLLQQSQAGDARALNDLLTRLRGYVHFLVRRRLGPEENGRLGHSSLVQKCLLRVSQRFGQLRTPEVPRFLNWLGRLVRNLVTDELRARPPEQPLGPAALEGLAAGQSPQAQLERDERAVRVAAALQQLPERQRQVVELRFFDRLKDAEICRRLGGSPESIRILRFRALRRLRALLEEAPTPTPPSEASNDA